MAAFGHEAKKLKPPTLTRQLTSAFDNEEPGAAVLQDDGGGGGLLFADAPTQFDEGVAAAAAASACKSAPSPRLRYSYRLGVATDIGGGATNQDDYAVWSCSDGSDFVMAVFDGHGRDLGELASDVAKRSMSESFCKPETFAELRQSPKQAMRRIFKQAHIAIKEAFRAKYLRDGWEVQDTEQGYVIKRPSPHSSWSCTHGGTTATVVVVFGESGKLIVANVGDSTALWGSCTPDGQCAFRELSAEHSPESISEFKRVRAFKAATSHSDPPHGAPNMSEMRFVYDAPNYSKHQCPNIFQVDGSDPDRIRITNNGNYYKNVRNEWASLVTTPPHARFQDALAFTRSLGDLHLHVYGVSFEPEILEFDLADLQSAAQLTETGSPTPTTTVLFVCTDGVWDNWRYDDITKFTCRPDLAAEASAGNDCQRATDRLMAENLKLARQHFGSQADNMTAVLCYIKATKT